MTKLWKYFCNFLDFFCCLKKRRNSKTSLDSTSFYSSNNKANSKLSTRVVNIQSDSESTSSSCQLVKNNQLDDIKDTIDLNLNSFYYYGGLLKPNKRVEDLKLEPFIIEYPKETTKKSPSVESVVEVNKVYEEAKSSLEFVSAASSILCLNKAEEINDLDVNKPPENEITKTDLVQFDQTNNEIAINYINEITKEDDSKNSSSSISNQEYFSAAEDLLTKSDESNYQSLIASAFNSLEHQILTNNLNEKANFELPLSENEYFSFSSIEENKPIESNPLKGSEIIQEADIASSLIQFEQKSIESEIINSNNSPLKRQSVVQSLISKFENPLIRESERITSFKDYQRKKASIIKK